MAKVAVERRVLAEGNGWLVADVLCKSGPDDRPFEEQHGSVAIAMVTGGTFQYRTGRTGELMSPGSFLLGYPGLSFECSHEHGVGDRCLSFQFTEEAFVRSAGTAPRFRAGRVPPMRETASLIARALSHHPSWEELATEVAGTIGRLANDRTGGCSVPSHVVARVARAIRLLEQQIDVTWSLDELAADARLSPYHFLRTFTQVAGVTPHQFALRARLREAAVRLATTDARIIDIALDCGFGDVSNFNRMFRAEFGIAPRGFRNHQRVGYVPSTFTVSAMYERLSSAPTSGSSAALPATST